MGLLLEEENHEPKNALGLELGDTESTLSFDTSTDTDDLDSTPLSRSLPCLIVHHPFEAIITAIALGWTLELFWTYPFPTTIPLFVGLATATVGFTLLAWVRLLNALRTANWRYPPGSNLWQAFRHPGTITPPSSPSSRTRCVPRRVALVASTCLMLYWCHLGLTPPAQPLPVLNRADPDVQERYFIAANLYNNEEVFKSWSTELIKLCEHLGVNNTFISIYESNSWDATKPLLSQLDHTLNTLDLPHRIVSRDDEARWWPYGTSPERINFLARARNQALLPLQSSDPQTRLEEYDQFTKVIFLNDVQFTWESIVRLVATRVDGDESKAGDYDLACGIDYASSGLYDTWVARDVCGTPLRPFWPFVKDQATMSRVRDQKPFEVSSCWNGAVVFPAKPYIYSPPTPPTPPTTTNLRRRGWKMIDNSSYPDFRESPALNFPIQFRSSGIDACDHSECFLFSYDLHRLYPTRERPPRIYMNPSVKVAYQENWYRWHNHVLRIPIVKWWLDHWSRGYPFMLVDWIWEAAGRRRDYCTWAGLNLPARCPALPVAVEESWNKAEHGWQD